MGAVVGSDDDILLEMDVARTRNTRGRSGDRLLFQVQPILIDMADQRG